MRLFRESVWRCLDGPVRELGKSRLSYPSENLFRKKAEGVWETQYFTMNSPPPERFVGPAFEIQDCWARGGPERSALEFVLPVCRIRRLHFLLWPRRGSMSELRLHSASSVLNIDRRVQVVVEVENINRQTREPSRSSSLLQSLRPPSPTRFHDMPSLPHQLFIPEEKTATFVIAVFTAAILVFSVIKSILTYVPRWLKSKFKWPIEMEARPDGAWTGN
jgi:hypothetical protein